MTFFLTTKPPKNYWKDGWINQITMILADQCYLLFSYFVCPSSASFCCGFNEANLADETAKLLCFYPSSASRVGKRLGQWELVHSSRGDYLVSLPQLCRHKVAQGAPGVVRWEAVSKRQEDRGGHIPGKWRRLQVILTLHRERFNLHSGKMDRR